ncbi:MAG: acyl-CoA dehydratase activase-related protein [Bacilli bacterium]|nr:acyl-CoA dehydratase activase-related protein [Bacilli bacterium]
MEKQKIGIPRGLYFYFFKDLYIKFFENLGVEVLISPPSNPSILNEGTKESVDEMCLPMKMMLGHISYLKDKCDYIVLPRIDNYGFSNQTCTYFLALYDIVNNMGDFKLLNYNIDEAHGQDETDGFLKMGRILGFRDADTLKCYRNAKEYAESKKRKMWLQNYKNLSKKNKKILLISHPYNLYDEMIGKPIVKYLESLGVTIIYSDAFDPTLARDKAKQISKELYWIYSKEALGSIPLSRERIDGMIFLSSFPCALDSLAYELAMRKVKKPYLYLTIDDVHSLTGIETRIESFIDIIEQQV